MAPGPRPEARLAPERRRHRPSSYTITTASADVVDAGPFFSAYPALLAPGETGYLAHDRHLAPCHSPEDFVTVEADVAVRPMSEPPAILFTVDAVRWQVEAETETMMVTGSLTATGPVKEAEVGVFCIGDAGKLVGFRWTRVNDLTANQPQAFTMWATPAAPPLRADQCAETLSFATNLRP